VTAFAMAALLQISAVTTGAQTYDDAYRTTNDTGKPLVVMIGTEWCPACVQMKQSVIPQVKRNGVLKKVAFALVNSDEQGPLAQRLMRGGSIPQLIVFRKTASGGWKRNELIGAHSASEVESFIRAESAAAEAKPATPVSKLSSFPKTK
jgi:thiol-disulfide isomerase/thioredoxin